MAEAKIHHLKPIIKWAGGKTKIEPLFSDLYTPLGQVRYVDLFCGSLSLPLLFKPKKAVFNDINTGLINLYRTIKEDLKNLLRELKKLNQEKYNTKEVFNELRDEFNLIKLERSVRCAALFLYLNKRSYNGLYRENRSGQYNVPYREYNTDIYNKQELRDLSTYFNENQIEFFNQDFESFPIDFFQDNDLVYIDPPYYPCKKSQFTSYWSKPFLVEEQKKLALFCRKLDERGIKFILSNAPCDEIKELYTGFNQTSFYIGRQMRNAGGKSEVFKKKNEPNEILIYNFKILLFEN